MAAVTVRTQTAFLDFADGETVTLERTAFVETLIRNGNVVVIEDGPADPPAEPKRNASRDDWAEYLAACTSIVTAGKGRDELLAEYDALAEE